MIYILDNLGKIQNAQNPVRSGRMGVSGEQEQNTEKSDTCGRKENALLELRSPWATVSQW